MTLSQSTLGRSTFVLERRVNRPPDAVARVLRDGSTVAPTEAFGLGDEGTLVIEEAPRRSPSMAAGQESWRTTAKLLTRHGRLVSRLDIEVSAWAPGSVFIQLRPLAGRPHRWGTRRTRRYFALAHAGADHLERLLSETSSAGAAGGHPPDLSGVTIRPIEAYDVDRLRGLFWRLSPASRYFRFLSAVTRPAEACLHHLVEVDRRDRDALVASVGDQIVGVARYDRDKVEPRHAEVAVVVEDAWHRRGIATALLHALTGVATERGVEHFTATVAAENRAVAKLVRSLPIRANWSWDAGQRNLDVDLRLLGA